MAGGVTCPGCSQATSNKRDTTSTRLGEHRGTMTGTNPNQRLWRNVHLAQASSLGAVPAEPSAPLPRRESCHNDPSETALWIAFQTKGCHCLEVWDILCDAGKEHFGDCTGLIGCLGKEPEAEKGRDLVDVGRNKCGK